MPITFQAPRRLGLAGAFLLMAVPAQGCHLVQSRRDLVEVHVTQLEQLLLLVEQGQTAAPPVGGSQRPLANGASLTLIPLLQQPFQIFGRRIRPAPGTPDRNRPFRASASTIAGDRAPRPCSAVENANLLSTSTVTGSWLSGQITVRRPRLRKYACRLTPIGSATSRLRR